MPNSPLEEANQRLLEFYRKPPDLSHKKLLAIESDLQEKVRRAQFLEDREMRKRFNSGTAKKGRTAPSLEIEIASGATQFPPASIAKHYEQV